MEPEEDVFGRTPWLPEEKQALQRLLETKIGLDKASFRPGPANSVLLLLLWLTSRNFGLLCHLNDVGGSEQHFRSRWLVFPGDKPHPRFCKCELKSAYIVSWRKRKESSLVPVLQS